MLNFKNWQTIKAPNYKNWQTIKAPNYKNWQTIKLPNCKIATDSCLELCHQQSFLRKLLDGPSCSCAATATTMMIIARSFKEWPRWASFPFREFPPPHFFSFAKFFSKFRSRCKKIAIQFLFCIRFLRRLLFGFISFESHSFDRFAPIWFSSFIWWHFHFGCCSGGRVLYRWYKSDAGSYPTSGWALYSFYLIPSTELSDGIRLQNG